MVPISDTVNSGTAHPISSDLFEGHVVAHIQGFTDERGNVRESEYFGREERKGVTWSIQVQGESSVSCGFLCGLVRDARNVGLC